jgi:ferritin-like metal-binding protein YciE
MTVINPNVLLLQLFPAPSVSTESSGIHFAISQNTIAVIFAIDLFAGGHTMSVETLQDAFEDELKDLLSAEEQLTEALPKMAAAATDANLQKAFKDHLKETEGHVERLKKVFESLDLKPTSKKCKAMAGLVKEGAEVMEETKDPATRDAFLIAAAQKVEHYEIASYGTMCTWAKCLGHSDAKKLLGQNLEEEEAADKKLSKLANAGINEGSAKEE